MKEVMSMNTTQAILQGEGYCEKAVLYMALELSQKTWRWCLTRVGRNRLAGSAEWN